MQVKAPSRYCTSRSYWLLVKDEPCPVAEVYTIGSEGSTALPVFDRGSKADALQQVLASGDHWKLRRTSAGELVSMLATLLRHIQRVAFDPGQEQLLVHRDGYETSGDVTPLESRERFMELLATSSSLPGHVAEVRQEEQGRFLSGVDPGREPLPESTSQTTSETTKRRTSR